MDVEVAGVAMNAYSVKYGFSQSFNVPAKKAFDWCTDYRPSDLTLMKEKGERRIQRITEDTVVMTETVHKAGMTIRKKKVVRLNKSNLSWTNTHVSGPNLYSQFLYEIVSVGKNRSRLNFTGLLICYSKAALSKRTLSRMAASERHADSRAWRHLAAAMTADLR
jgi:hypothetical protein